MSVRSLYLEDDRPPLPVPVPKSTKANPKIITPVTKTEIVYDLDKYRDDQKFKKFGWKRKVGYKDIEIPDPEVTLTQEEEMLQKIILRYPDTDKYSSDEMKSLRLKYKLLYWGLWFLMVLLVAPNGYWMWLLLKYWGEDVTFAIKTLDVLMPIVVVMQVTLTNSILLFQILVAINCWSKKMQDSIQFLADATNGLFFSQLVVFIPLLGYAFGNIYDYRISRRMELANKCMESKTWKITQQKHNCCGENGIDFWDHDYVPPSCCPVEIKEGENCTNGWKTDGCLSPERHTVTFYLSIVFILLIVDLVIFVSAYFGYRLLKRWEANLLHLDVVQKVPISPDDEDGNDVIKNVKGPILS